MQASTPLYYTPEEYLQLEETAKYRSEYHDGEIIAMTGGTDNHNQISGNLYIALSIALKTQMNRVFIADMRLWIPQVRLHTYPDLMVISGQPEFVEARRDTLTNPQLIIEVLSKSTRNYDQGDKFEFYRTLPSFQEYVLVDQYKPRVQQFCKVAEKQWTLTEISDETATLQFASIPVQISLAEIYDRVQFES